MWEERDVGADEEGPEVQLTCPFRVLTPRHLADPVIDPGENAKHGSKAHHVVEVCDHIVGVMVGPVDSCLRQYDAGHAANGEQEQEPDGKEHRCLEADRAAPHGGNPREDFHACRHRDHHGGQHEVGLLCQGHANGVHVVCPNDEAQSTDRNHRPNHRQVAEDWFLGEGRDDVADDAEGRQDHDIHFRMAKEPQDVLVENRVATAGRIKECRAKIAVGQQHGDCACKNGQGEKDQPCCHKDRPREQGHLEQRHAGCAHIQECCNNVDRTKDRRRTGHVDRKDREIHREAGFGG